VNLKFNLNHRDTESTENSRKSLCDLSASVVHFIFSCLLVTTVLTACQPKPTPFPVDIPPTPTLTPVPGAPNPIRYALAANTAGLVADMNLIAASGSIEQLTADPNPADIGARFDVIAAYGKWPDAAESPVLPRVALVIHSTLAPFDDPAVVDVVRRALNPSTIVSSLEIPGAEAAPIATAAPIELRTALANAGWPDGFDVIITYTPIAGLTQITEQFAAIGINSQFVPLANSKWERVHLAIITWATPEERAEWATRAGADSNVIDLFSLPISYWAAREFSITFTPGGWPLATRP
jgi:hypothetical protein